MSYILLIIQVFSIYILIYYLSILFLNKNLEGIDIRKILDNALKKTTLKISADSTSTTRPYYDVLNKSIHINDKPTILNIITVFHELGHALSFQNRRIPKNDLVTNLIFLFLNSSYLLGIFGVMYSETITFSSKLELIIKLLLLIGNIYLIFLIKEEFLANKLGYSSLKENIPHIFRKYDFRIKFLFLHSFSTYLVLFLVTLMTTIYYF